MNELSKIEFDRISGQARKEIIRTTESPPEIEVIEPREIYLLDQGHRVKRICGRLDEYGWPCTNAAGYETFHVGIGKCSKHEGIEVGKKEYLDRYLEVLSTSAPIQKYIKLASSADKESFSGENLLRVIYALLLNHLNDAQYSWSKKESLHVLDLVDAARKLMESNSKIESQKIISTGIVIWLRSVLMTIQNSVSIETFSKIKDQILSIELPRELETIEFSEVK
jgi:hypothetical protein